MVNPLVRSKRKPKERQKKKKKNLQQATIVVCALVLFLAGSSSHIVPHRGSMVIAFSTARRPGDRQAPALTLQHTHTHHTTPHTHSPSLLPQELGHLLGTFSKSQLYVVTWHCQQKKPSCSSSVNFLLDIFTPARLISGWSFKFPHFLFSAFLHSVKVLHFSLFAFQKKKIT